MPQFDLDDLAHHAREIGPLPVVQHFLQRLRVEELLAQFVPTRKLGRPTALPNSRALSAMVSNILTSREPLYAQAELAVDTSKLPASPCWTASPCRPASPNRKSATGCSTPGTEIQPLESGRLLLAITSTFVPGNAAIPCAGIGPS